MRRYCCRCKNHTPYDVLMHDRVVNERIREIVKKRFYERMSKVAQTIKGDVYVGMDFGTEGTGEPTK